MGATSTAWGRAAVLAERLSSLQTLPVGLAAADEAGRVVWWNERAVALVGAALPGMTIEALQDHAADKSHPWDVRIAPGHDTDGPLTWIVVTPRRQDDDDLLEAFAHQALHDHLT